VKAVFEKENRFFTGQVIAGTDRKYRMFVRKPVVADPIIADTEVITTVGGLPHD
jgi:hypothetical protein